MWRLPLIAPLSGAKVHAFEALTQAVDFVVDLPDFVQKMFECLTFETTPRIQTLSDWVLVRGRKL
jgi:hypothetical protein